MLVKKLKNRCSSAEKINPSEGSQHMIRNHRFRFHKKSGDGSAKGDAEETKNSDDVVYGVLFSIIDEEIGALNKFEGLDRGYNKKTVDVIVEKYPTHDPISAITYYATTINPNLLPYDWYKRQTVQGAIDNGLPDDYIKKLEDFESKYDKKESRRKDEEKYFKSCGRCGCRQYFESHTPGDCTTTSTPRN